MPNELLYTLIALFLFLAMVSGYCLGVQREKDRAIDTTPLKRALAALRKIENWHELRKTDRDMPIDKIVRIAREGQGRELD